MDQNVDLKHGFWCQSPALCMPFTHHNHLLANPSGALNLQLHQRPCWRKNMIHFSPSLPRGPLMLLLVTVSYCWSCWVLSVSDYSWLPECVLHMCENDPDSKVRLQQRSPLNEPDIIDCLIRTGCPFYDILWQVVGIGWQWNSIQGNTQRVLKDCDAMPDKGVLCSPLSILREFKWL